jgi:Flp pilus assembly protein TadD
MPTRPVSNLSFALNYYLHGQNVVGYHAVNILIHILGGLFLFHFVHITLTLPPSGCDGPNCRWIAFFTALIWLVHPVQTQSITYIVQRMNSMAAMFYILSFLLYAKYRLASRVWEKRTYLTGCLIAGLLALGSKEIAATLPFFILLYEWYFFKNLDPQWLKRRALIWAGILIFSVIIVYLFLGSNPITKVLNGYNDRHFSIGQRLLTEFRVVVFFLSLMVWPHPSRLNLDHDFSLSHTLVDPVTTLPAIGIITAMIVLGICLAKKERLFSFCILWFFGNLIIESSVIPLEIIFDHRNYLPSMLAVLAVVLILFRFAKPRWLGVSILIAAGILFSVWTYERNNTWKNTVTIWQDSVLKSPHKARPHNNLGVAHMNQGDLEKAIEHFRKAVTIRPHYANAHYNLGTIFITKNKIQEAIGHLLEAVRLVPDNLDALNNLASALIMDKRYKEAIAYLDKALEIDPDFAQLHNNYGYAHRLAGNLEMALQHLQKAIQINPEFAEAHNNLGLVYSDQQDYASASYHFAEAVRILPSHKQARNNLKLSNQLMQKSTSTGIEN